MADVVDRWTVRGISRATQRKAADLAARADVTLGVWLSRLIDSAAGSADIAPDIACEIASRLARHETILCDVLDRLAALESGGNASLSVTTAKADIEPILPVDAVDPELVPVPSEAIPTEPLPEALPSPDLATIEPTEPQADATSDPTPLPEVVMPPATPLTPIDAKHLKTRVERTINGGLISASALDRLADIPNGTIGSWLRRLTINADHLPKIAAALDELSAGRPIGND